MIPKCYLKDYSPYLQLIGIVAMIFILFIAVYYYIQVSHANIVEKYASGAINANTIEYKTPSSGDRSSYTEDKYPGAKLELVKSLSTANEVRSTLIPGSADDASKKLDVYSLRPCRVYFDSNTSACDANQDAKKTCSYTFDGWQEFASYTDKYSSNITYPKKIYTGTSTNTDELINSYFTSKCFKEFTADGIGSAKAFEYNENSLVKFDSKGATDNTQRDTNIFGGKKYTSIQFLNTANHGDNFDNVINSICSVKYNTIRALEGKKFYKIILNSDNIISAIHKVSINNDQNTFTTDNTSAAAEFAILGSHGLRFEGNQLQIFIKNTNIKELLKIYAFKYVSNICTTSQIKEYTSYAKNITVSDFLTFGSKDAKVPTTKTLSGIANVNILSASSYSGVGVDYKKSIINDLDKKHEAIIDRLNKESERRKDGYREAIKGLDEDIKNANYNRNNFTIGNNRLLDVLAIEYKDVKNNNTSTSVFPYKRGYTNNVVGTFDIPDGAVPNYYNSSDIYFTFHNRDNVGQKVYSFTVPSGQSYTCDILVVGGGGAGGCYAGGGGGGGDVRTQNGITFGAGTHTITVGGGGNYNYWTIGGNGNLSSIRLSNSATYTAGGGGGGASYYDATPSVPVFNSSWGYSNGGGGGGNNLFGQYFVDLYRSWGFNWGISTETGGASGKNISGNGGNGSKIDHNNWTSRGGGGGGGGGNKNGNGEAGTGTRGGNGGTGVSLNFYGTGAVTYGQGGGGGIVFNTGTTRNSTGNVDGTGSGGSSWHTYVRAISGSASTGDGGGGGGYDGHFQGGNGGSGIVVIKVKELSDSALLALPKITTSSSNGYYQDVVTSSSNNSSGTAISSSTSSSTTESFITIPSSKAQTCILTAFVYLQEGYYRFRADIANTTFNGHPNIIKAELGIYDQTNLKAGTADYTPRTVFKCYNNVPRHLKSYLHIRKSKFYKIAYSYIAYNINDYFYLYYKYFSSEPRTGISPAAITINDTGSYNADNNYGSEDINNINTSMNDYLFYGTALYNHYTDNEITKIFSTINYDNNNSNALKNLADYLYKDSIDYFNVLKYNDKKRIEQGKVDREPDLLKANIAGSTDINNVKGLITAINGINYKAELPINDPVLMSSVSFDTIFGANNTSYITYDTLTATTVAGRNISNSALGKGVYIESFNDVTS